MEIGASLERLELYASDPAASAAFYRRAFGMHTAAAGDSVVCRGPQRELRLHRGPAQQLAAAVFRFADEGAWQAYRRRLGTDDDREFAVVDPEGRRIVFLAPGAPQRDAGAPLAARLQHCAVRTPQPRALVDYYVGTLGFVLSDEVQDAAGNLTAAFLRTDAEHHALAIFRAPAVRFDHYSCETDGWHSLRAWADHLAGAGIDLAWGIGRHGPGNDTFLMVTDPDGNLAEISSDLEVCASGRPAGVWPHRPQTLNRWGVAIMRS